MRVWSACSGERAGGPQAVEVGLRSDKLRLRIVLCRSAALLLLFCRFATLRDGPAAARNLIF